MANASEISELQLFRAQPIPFVFRILSGSLTKAWEVTGGAKAEQSQENENILQDRNLQGQLERHSQCLAWKETHLHFATGNENTEHIYNDEVYQIRVQLNNLSGLC